MPTFIEDEIKEELSDFVRNCIILGEGRDYLIALLTLKSKIDENNEPIDEFDEKVLKNLRSFDIFYTKPSEIARLDKDNNLMKFFREKIKLASARASIAASYSTEVCEIKNFKVLPRDFSIKKEELNSLLKIRRNKVLENFTSEINECYITA
jgi:long-subunit acyl-CoA synthetase (AMP-forming)